MKHLSDWVSFQQPTTLCRALFYSCLEGRCLGLMRMMLLLLLTAAFPLYAQSPIQWDKTIGGSGFDALRALQPTRNGGYILGGSSSSPISGDKTEALRGDPEGNFEYTDYWVVKLDSAGNKQWDKTIGGFFDDGLTALLQTPDGGYLLGGYSNSGKDGDKTQANKGSFDYWLVKLDSLGSKQWDRTIGGSGEDRLYSLQQTRDSGFILGGSSNSGISGDKTEANRGIFPEMDYWLVKLDSLGNKQWDRTIGGSDNDDEFQSLQQTPDGGYILGGSSFSDIGGDKTEASKGGRDFWIVKLDSAGKILWDRTLGGDNWDTFASLQQTSEGGFILGGSSNSGTSGDKTEANRGICSDTSCTPDFWVVKLDSAGNKQWDKTIGGFFDDGLTALLQTTEGGYLLGGHSNSSKDGDKTQANKGGYDYWLVKLDSLGSKQWDRTIGGKANDMLATIEQASDSSYVLGGSSRSGISGDKTEANKGEDYDNWDYWVVKLAPYPEGGQVKSFTLINTQSEQPIGPLQDGDTLNLAELPKKLNIRANTLPARVGSVKLQLSGKQKRTQVENQVPYALFGDRRGDYEKWYPAPGSYTLTATPYSQPKGQGQAGTPLIIHFTVVNKKVPLRVESFTLIDAEKDQPIMAIQEDEEIDLATLPSRKLNIRANTIPARVGSVKLQLSRKQQRTQVENNMPYALFGDTNGDYNEWTPPTGSYTLTATPYSKKNGKGKAGIPFTIRFRIEHLMIEEPAGARVEQELKAARPELAPRLTLYPNPTPDGRIRVQLAGQVQGQVRYSLLSSVGRKLAAGALAPTQTGNLLEFDFSGQIGAAGMYYLRLEGKNVQQVFKIMRR